MSFSHVHRLTPKQAVVASQEEVQALASELRKLGMVLPAGYHEYVTTFGRGIMGDYLQVLMPEEVQDSRFKFVEYLGMDGVNLDAAGLTGSFSGQDWSDAVIWAICDQRPVYACCPRFGGEIFQVVDDDTMPIPGGLFGLVDHCTECDFPYFDPCVEGRKNWVFEIKGSMTYSDFVAAAAERWGHEALLQSRANQLESYPRLFIPAIGGMFVLYFDEWHLKHGYVGVRATYDVESEAILTEFVESVLRPGGKSSNSPYHLGRLWQS